MRRIAFGLAVAACAPMLMTPAPASAEPSDRAMGSTGVRAGSVTAAAGAGVELTATESALVDAINKTRDDRGIDALRLNDDLVRAARFHSSDMINRGYFEHGPVSRRLIRFGFKAGTIGENLGWQTTHKNAVPALIGMWLGSPPHRKILLSRQFHAVGVGIRVGRFKGWDRAVVVTVDFWTA